MNVSDMGNLLFIYFYWLVMDINFFGGGIMLYNMMDEEYFFSKMGFWWKDMFFVVCLFVIYCFIFVIGVVGNVCIVIVIVRNWYM